MPRLFFGVQVPVAHQHALRGLRNALVEAGVQAGAWSNPELYHLTLVFLGDCAEDTLPLLVKSGTNAAVHVNSFRLTLQDLGMFERSGVLWAGITEDVGAMALRTLQAHLFQALQATQRFQLEFRPFRPHLTLARSVPKHQAALIRRLRAWPQEQLQSPSFEVTYLCLFESTRQNGQLVYPVMQKFPLGGQSGLDL